MSSSRAIHLAGLLALAAHLGCATEDGAEKREGPEAGAVCEGPLYRDAPSDGVTFVGMSATVVDGSGAPVPNLRAQACGLDLCLNGETGPGGYVAIESPASLVEPAFKYGDGRTHAKIALPLAGDPVDIDLAEQITVALPAAAKSSPFTPGSDVTSGGVTLLLPENLVPVSPDPFDFDTPELQGFRAALFPDGVLPQAVDAELGVEILVALSPPGATLCPSAGLSVPNTRGWAPGTRVDFLLHGVEIEEEWAPYGGWVSVSEGEVSADGARIATDPGGGIPALSLVGIRLAP